MDPEKLLTGISKEIETALKELKKAKDPQEKLIRSKIFKNLCQSLSVFLNFIVPYDDDYDYDDDDDEDEDEMWEFES
ncbi:MAG: hypothetical protein D6812_01065 [Deltaproteobacteria bacterium]|nr:MAG: hypothetical protein D6812_01065 [Deltaproteobacteria bacterium]